MNATECFGTALPTALTTQTEKAVALNTIIRITITGPNGGDWTVSLKGPSPTCRPYMDTDATAIQAAMTLASSDFDAFLASASTSVQMFLTKRLVVTGPLPTDAIKLRLALKLMAP